VTADPRLIEALEPLVRRVRTDVTAKKDTAGMSWTREPLTDQRLAKHLNGGPARGVCPIKAGESVTMVGLLDLDSHKGESSWEEMTAAASAVCAELEARFLEPVVFRSSGGRGIHIYVLWDEPQDAYSVRQELTGAIGLLGFCNGTAGVSRGEIEVFPKQNSVPADGFGNQFILPLAGKSEPLGLGSLLPLGKEAVIGMTWPSSAPVPRLEAPVRNNASTMQISDLGMLDRALFVIPNDAAEGPDRDEWFRLMCAFKEGGGETEVARAWTLQHPSYTDAGFDGPWDSIKVGHENGTPVDYLFRVAQGHGFHEHIVDEFEVVATPQAEPEAEPWPAFERDKQGKILPTVTNAVAALRREDFCDARIAHDEFKDATLIAWTQDKTWRALRDTDYTRLRGTLEKRGFKNPGRELVRDGVMQIAEDNRFDSAKQWAGSLTWDGVPRVDGFLAGYMGVASGAYAQSVSRYIWTAMAARCLVPGAKCDMVPVLVGGQGTGKSTGVMAMAPEPDAYVEVNLEHRDDNLARSLRGKLVGELGELRGLATKDAEAIKAWITRTHEEWIPKYVEFATKFARRLLFIGTTNSDEFLADDTGERRWLPVDVGTIDVAGIERDRDQLWAEAIVLFKRGGVQWQQALTLAADKHDHYKVSDPWQSAIEGWLNSDEMDSAEGAPRCAAPFKLEHLLHGALALDARNLGMREQKRAASVLRRLGFAKRRATRAEGGKHIWERAENCTLDELA
jgi:hypothetical protein